MGRRRSPAKPSMAGSSVIETRTASPTPTAAATPMTVRNGMPATPRPTSAIMTVRPAKMTAEPAVATARAVASSTLRPVASSSRCRDTMNSA
ncbi:Uncharacterised protein [Mycobacteroides abscessus]|nr:Uncharacterised protein [Mycobacteroides abscessus]